MLVILIISLQYIYSYGQHVPYNSTCTFTHDCADWREGRVICDETKRCTCRQAYSTNQGKVFWDSTSHRCIYCPHKWFQRETRCYYFLDEKLIWSNARQKCQSIYMGDLLVFDSPDNLDWIRKYGMEMTVEFLFAHGGDASYRRFWIGAMNEPFSIYGRFSWIDNRGFQFDQSSLMWCRPNFLGVPAWYGSQPSWNQNTLNETRVSLVRWRDLTYNKLSVYCLDDEQPNEVLSSVCERTSVTFKTKCEINKNICQNDGICTAVTESDMVLCDCTETPYGGTDCTGQCGELSSHCQNGGNCTRLGNCVCTSLWTGPLCVEAIDPCLLNPCQHDTKCSQVGNTPNFICDCEDSGWTGELCDITKYPCPAGRCSNNGQCKAVGRGNFTCNCLKTGYQGVFCEQGCLDTDEPCQNSGSCIDNKCICNPSTQGDFCETIDDKDSASSQLNKDKPGLTLWLIVILCIVSIILIIGLIYGRKKLLKSREQRRNLIDEEISSMATGIQNIEANESDSVSIAPSQSSKYIEEYSSIDEHSIL